MSHPLTMFNSINSGNESQARHDASHLTGQNLARYESHYLTQNQARYDSPNLVAQNQASYDASSHLSAQNQARYDSSHLSAQNQSRSDSPNFSAQNLARSDSSNFSAQNLARYDDSSHLSAQNQARYDSSNMSVQNQAKSDSPGAQTHERFYASSPTVQPHGLYSNQGRFDPPNMMAQQQARFDATNTFLAQQQARYYTQLQAGFYSANSVPNAQSVFQSPNMLSQYQPSFYYPYTQQMLLGSNVPSGYPYPFQSYNLNSAYGGNTYFNMNSLQPTSVNPRQLPTQQAAEISSTSPAASNISANCNLAPIPPPSSQKMDNRKTKQVKRKQKENEPKEKKTQQRKRRKKQELVHNGANEAVEASPFLQTQTSSMPFVSSTSADLMQNLQMYEQIKASQQDLQPRTSTLPQNAVSPVASSTYNETDISLHSKQFIDNYQKFNTSFNSVYNKASVHNYRQFDNMSKHSELNCDLERQSASSDHKDNFYKDYTRVSDTCYTASPELNKHNENMNFEQTASEKDDKLIVAELVNQDKMHNENTYKDLVLQMPVSDGQLSSSTCNQSENMQTVYQRNKFYNHLYNGVVDLSVTSSENKSLNSAHQTKIDIDSGFKQSQLFESSVTSSSTHQSWIKDDTKNLYPPKEKESGADDKNVFKAGENMCQTMEVPSAESDYNMPKDEQFINKTHPVTLLNQMITELDKTKSCLKGSKQLMDNEQFQSYSDNQSNVSNISQGALNLKNINSSDFTHLHGKSSFDYHNSLTPAPNGNNYHYDTKPTVSDFNKSDSSNHKEKNLYCDTLSTGQSLYINTQQFSQFRSHLDSPEEVQIYPENTLEDCAKFWDSQIHQHNKSNLQPQGANINLMQKEPVVSSEGEPVSFPTSSYKTDVQNNHSMQTMKQFPIALSGSEDTREESGNDKFQAKSINEKPSNHSDFDSKWEIIYSSESKEKPSSTMIEPKISQESHEMNYDQDDFYIKKNKDISPEQKGNQYHHEYFQRCSQPEGTLDVKTPTSEDLESKWDIIYSKEVNGKKSANTLGSEFQITTQSAQHSVEDHCHQSTVCNGDPQNDSLHLKMKEDNGSFKCASPKASIAIELKDDGLIADVDKEKYKTECSVVLDSSKVKVENTEIRDIDLKHFIHENTADMQLFKVKDDVDSVKRKLFFTEVVRRSVKCAGKQTKEETYTSKVRQKQTNIFAFFKRDNSSKNGSVSDRPSECQKSQEIPNKMVTDTVSQISDYSASESIVLESSRTVTELEKPVVPGTRNSKHRLEAKTHVEKQAQFKGLDKMFMSRGKQILLKSQEQSEATMQFEMLSKTLTFKTPASSLKPAGCHKRSKISQSCKRNKRSGWAKVSSKSLAAVNLRDTPGSKVCPTMIVREIKYLFPLTRELSFSAQSISRYFVIKVEDKTRMYKPLVSQMITGAKPTPIKQEAAPYQYTGNSSSNLRITTLVDNFKGGNSFSEKTSVVVPALAKKVCDICGWSYSCTIDQHINSDKHQSYINKPGFYAGLDDLISSIGCIDKLISSLNAHSTGAIAQYPQGNTNNFNHPNSNNDIEELYLGKDDKSNHPAYLSTKPVFQIAESASGVKINASFRIDSWVDKSLIVQAARLNIINPTTISRKRKNLETMEKTAVVKQRKISSKQCCTNITEVTICVHQHLSGLFDNMNINSLDKNSNDATNPDSSKDKTNHSIDFNQITPYIYSKSVNRPMRQLRLPKFIKVKKTKSKVVTFRVPSPTKVKVMSLAASENLFQQCIDEMKNGSLIANRNKLFSQY